MLLHSNSNDEKGNTLQFLFKSLQYRIVMLESPQTSFLIYDIEVLKMDPMKIGIGIWDYLA